MGNLDSIPGSGRSPGEEHGNPLQYSCLENFMDRGAWWALIHGVAKESNTTERLTPGRGDIYSEPKKAVENVTGGQCRGLSSRKRSGPRSSRLYPCLDSEYLVFRLGSNSDCPFNPHMRWFLPSWLPAHSLFDTFVEIQEKLSHAVPAHLPYSDKFPMMHRTESLTCQNSFLTTTTKVKTTISSTAFSEMLF